MSTVDTDRMDAIQLLADTISTAPNEEKLQAIEAQVKELDDAQLMVLYYERKEKLGSKDSSKSPAELKLEREMYCLAVVAACSDADKLRTEVVEKLRPLVAHSESLPDKLGREMASRYVSLTGSKGHWSSRTIAKLLRERPKAALPAAMVELTHVGVAQQVLQKHDGNLRTVVEHTKDSWLRWTGERWMRLADKQTAMAVGEYIDELKATLLASPDLDAKEARNVALTLGHVAFNHGVVSSMGHRREAQVSDDELNTHSEYLAVANGAVHLPTGTLVQDRELLLTVQSKIAFNPEAQCPEFFKALQTTFQGRAEDVEYYELIMGYALLGCPTERAVFFHIGEGNNGKSLLLNAICHALGGEHAPVLNYRLIASEPGASISGDANAASPAQYKLRNARLGFIDELPKGGVMRDAQLKFYASGDSVMDARKLGQGLVDFPMTAVLMVLCNAQVAIRGAQPSTWHRTCPVAYKAKFKDDPTLPGKLRAEAEGILAWLVRCARKYLQLRKDNLGLRDKMPASAREALDTMKKAQDPLAEWLEDCCELAQDGGMSSVEGWKAFLAYHEQRESELPQSVKSDRLWFERMLSVPGVRDSNGNLVLVNRKDGTQKRSRGFYGIQFKGSTWGTKAQLEREHSQHMRDAEVKRDVAALT
jgi:putative DNA primase/helicase